MLKIDRMESNTVDPDETAHHEPPHLDLVFANSAIVVFGALEFKAFLSCCMIKPII